MILLWRDSWLKPLSDIDIGADSCSYCRKAFGKIEFVTGCDFCEIGVMHNECANNHILKIHGKELSSKIKAHRDKPLHDYQ